MRGASWGWGGGGGGHPIPGKIQITEKKIGLRPPLPPANTIIRRTPLDKFLVSLMQMLVIWIIWRNSDFGLWSVGGQINMRTCLWHFLFQMEYISRNDEPCKISTVTLLNITLLLSAKHQPLFHTSLYKFKSFRHFFFFAVCYRHFAGEKNTSLDVCH